MTFGTYFILKNFRDIVDIEDTLDDITLTTFGNQANQQIDTDLAPFGDKLPLTGDLLSIAQNASLMKVASLWKAKKQNKDLADYYNKEYQSLIKSIQISLRSQPSITNRTKRASVTTDYVTKPLFSQTKKF